MKNKNETIMYITLFFNIQFREIDVLYNAIIKKGCAESQKQKRMQILKHFRNKCHRRSYSEPQ